MENAFILGITLKNYIPYHTSLYLLFYPVFVFRTVVLNIKYSLKLINIYSLSVPLVCKKTGA